MKVGFRTPNLKSSIKARTTGRAKRAVKRAVVPGYGKKGMGIINNPKKAVYNKVYNKTTVGLSDIVKGSSSNQTSSNQYTKIDYSSLPTSKKSKTVTLLICIFFGYLGIHRFYVGKIGSGVVWLFTAGAFFIGWISDIVKIASGKFLDSNGNVIRK